MKYQEVAMAGALTKPGPACTWTIILLSPAVVADQGTLVNVSMNKGASERTLHNRSTVFAGNYAHAYGRTCGSPNIIPPRYHGGHGRSIDVYRDFTALRG